MADEPEIVKQAVLEFLKTADMNVTTERTVLNHLAATLQLSQDVKTYKSVVSDTIDQFLEALDDGAEEEEAEEPQEEEEDERAAKAGGRKRAGGAAGGAAAKKSRSSSGGGDDVLLHVDLSDRRKARVRRYEGRLHVDVREFYKKDGEDAPTQKGLSMDPGQWARLARELPRLVAAQRAGGGGGGEVPPAQLAKTRLAAVSEYKGTYYLGLREYYEKDGQLLPGKKGVSLNPSEAEALLAASSAITTAAGGVPADLPPLEPPAALPGPGSGSGSAPSKPGPSKAAASVPPATAAAAAAASGEPTEMVDLGSNKRLSISHFGGRTSVDLREFYDKDGQKLPGKKGIALAPADWHTLCSALPAISAALSNKDMGYVLQLSGKRRVSLSEFKGTVYVGVREYYEKDGQLLPGAKGLSMNAAQWAALVAGAPGFNAALQGQE